jgi:hypothetical protein
MLFIQKVQIANNKVHRTEIVSARPIDFAMTDNLFDRENFTRYSYVMSLTKSDLQNIKKAVGDELHEQLSNYHADMVKPEFDKINQRLDGHDNHYKWLKDDISGLKADLSDQVSNKEFSKLKSKVDQFVVS